MTKKVHVRDIIYVNYWGGWVERRGMVMPPPPYENYSARVSEQFNEDNNKQAIIEERSLIGFLSTSQLKD